MTPEVLEQLITAIAEQIAPRVAAALAGHEQAPTEIEPWRTIGLPEAAERLGRSERWVRERTKDAADPLPFLRLGDGSLRFDADDVRAWARRRRVPAVDEEQEPRLKADAEDWWRE